MACPCASRHWSVQCCGVAFLLLLPVSLVIVVALWTVFVNSTKIRGSVLLKRYPERHGQVTAYNRSPVH